LADFDKNVDIPELGGWEEIIMEKTDTLTDTSLKAGTGKVQLERTPVTPALFINWPVHDSALKACNLLDDVDFTKYKLIFFDPHRFAIANNLVSPEAEISESNYASLSEREIVRYLSGTRRATESLRKFLENDGLLIVRSNIPKSHIKLRKKSSTGTRTYTESVVSSFFWLEDLIGSYSLNYIQAKTLNFVNQKHPLLSIFGKSGVRCVQTLASTKKAEREVIATTGSSATAAAISRLSFETKPGQIFFVPQFLVKGETEKMIEAFELVASSSISGSVRPRWLEYYEKQVRDYSPYRSMIEDVDLKMEALTKQLASLNRKQEVFDGLPQLLFESDLELEMAARTALDILGYVSLLPPSERQMPAFEVHIAGNKGSRLMIRTTHSDSGPVLEDQVIALKTAIEGRTSALPAKGILIGNTARGVRPEDRKEWFDEATIERATSADICLMPSIELFTMACYIMTRHSTPNLEALKTSLRRDIQSCDAAFVLSRKKYAI
jgi:hypothetical protein